MSTPLTPIDTVPPIQASEMIARVAVSLSMMTWMGVILALFWR
jgi:hypothetical protein